VSSKLRQQTEEPTPGPMTVRPYRPADRARIKALTIQGFAGVAVEHAIEQQWPGTTTLTWGERKFLEVDADLASHPESCFVAERAGDVVGFITTAMSEVKSQGHVRDLVIDGGLRGRGIGRQLLLHALKVFRQHGVRIARIETLSQNAVGAHLYPEVGFRLIATQNHYAMRLDEDGE